MQQLHDVRMQFGGQQILEQGLARHAVAPLQGVGQRRFHEVPEEGCIPPCLMLQGKNERA